MFASINDIIGKYAVDNSGNSLPTTREWTLKYVCHTGTEVYCDSPTGDSSDSLIFGHFAGSSAEAINRMFDGHMVRIKQEMQYDYNAEVWYWFNTIYFAR